MAEFKEEPGDAPPQDEIEPAAETQTGETWLQLVLGIPYIGGILTTLIAVAPMVLILLILDWTMGIAPDSGTGDDIPPGEFWLVLLFLPVWHVWLRYLERKAGLAICLPLPVVNIRIKWLLIPFGILWVLMYTERFDRLIGSGTSL